MVLLILKILGLIALLLSFVVIVMGFLYFEEWEIGIEFLPKGYNNFELGVSNRNYNLTDGASQQELRIGVLLFTFIFVFTRFDA